MSQPKSRSFAQSLGGFASGSTNPREFLEECIADIDARESGVKAFVVKDLAAARKAADASSKRWHAGAPLSSIDGMPVGIKDIIETADMPTQMGSPLFEGHSTGFDSASVHALREAGAVIIGKTVTTEFAASHPGPTCNPHDLARTPGGSSSGSAAGVACGMFSGALGTQVVGSIVRPSSYCGVYGFKPSLGGINRGGSHDFMSQSCQGVLAATLEDAWQMAIEIVMRTGGDPGHSGLIGPPVIPDSIRPAAVAYLETPGWAKASKGARELMQHSIERLRQSGVKIVTRKESTAVNNLETALDDCLATTRAVNAWESRWPINTLADRDASKLSASMIERLQEAESMSVEDYRRHLQRRHEIRQAYAALASEVAACITLSAPDVAPLGLSSTGDPIYAVHGSLLGVPAINLPLGKVGGLPLGIQTLGFIGMDAELFSVSGALVDLIGEINIQ